MIQTDDPHLARLFDLVRKEIEFLIFFPRPEWHWPLKDDHELYQDYGQIDLRGINRKKGKDRERQKFEAAKAGYRTAMDNWHDLVRFNRRNKVIKLDLAGELNDALSDV